MPAPSNRIVDPDQSDLISRDDVLESAPRPEQLQQTPRTHVEKVGQLEAEIGPIKLKDEFSDPDVDVSHTRETTDHEVVTGHTEYIDDGIEFVVQALGRKPPEIDITAWLTEDQVSKADDLVSEQVIELKTGRYYGEAIPESIDIPYSRVYHDKHGWIFEVSFEFLGIGALD